MPTPQELEKKFWKALKSDMTLMLGLDGVEDGHARPMTAQLEHDDRGPIWFFAAKDNAIVQKLRQGDRAIATFASKGHDLFATMQGIAALFTGAAQAFGQRVRLSARRASARTTKRESSTESRPVTQSIAGARRGTAATGARRPERV